MKTKRLILVFLVLAMMFALTACGSGNQKGSSGGQSQTGSNAEQKPVYGGSLAVIIPTDPDTLDAHKFAAAVTEEVIYNIYEGLVGSNTKGEIIPKIAERWEISPDNLTYTFYLRKNVYFHNGRQVKADDVKFSLERLMDPKTGNRRVSDFKVVKSIDVVDDYTVKITLKEPSAPFLSLLADVSSAIVPREAVDNLKTHPVGTGPFKFVEWKPNQEIKLVKNDKYWNPKLPYLNEATFKIIADPSTALMNLKTGQADVFVRMPPENAAEIKANPDTKLIAVPQNMTQLLVLNNARPPLNNLKVRQALNYAINKQEIIKGAMWGYGTELGSNMSPVMSYWYKDLTQMYPYNPEKAKQLLAEAGYPNGFEMTLALPAPYPPHIKTGEIIKDQLAKVGVKLNLQIVEWGNWLDKIYKGRDYDMTIIGFTGKLDPSTVLGRYASTYPMNFNNFKDEEYDKLIEQGIKTTDPAKRQEIYKRCQEILAEKAVAVFIQDPNLLIGMRKNVEGWQTYPIYVDDLSTVYKTK